MSELRRLFQKNMKDYYNIYNDEFLRKVFSWKRRKGLAWLQCDMDWMSFEDKVDYVVGRLSAMRFDEARMILEYWEKASDMVAVLEECHVENYEIVKEYKMRHMTPGVININFKGSFDPYFLKVLIKKHYGYELAKNDVLAVWPYLAIDNGKQIIAIKLYDDRGFYEYVWQKK